MQGMIRTGQRNKYVRVPYPDCGHKECSLAATVSISKGGATKHYCTAHIPSTSPQDDTERLLKELGLL